MEFFFSYGIKTEIVFEQVAEFINDVNGQMVHADQRQFEKFYADTLENVCKTVQGKSATAFKLMELKKTLNAKVKGNPFQPKGTSFNDDDDELQQFIVKYKEQCHFNNATCSTSSETGKSILN